MLLDIRSFFSSSSHSSQSVSQSVSQTLCDLKSVTESLLLNYQCKTSGASEVGSIWTSWSLYIRLWTTFIHQEGKMKKKLIRENIFPHDRFIIPITFAQLLHFFLNPAYQYPLLSILYSAYFAYFAYCAYCAYFAYFAYILHILLINICYRQSQEPGGCSIHSSQSSGQMPEMIDWLINPNRLSDFSICQ